MEATKSQPLLPIIEEGKRQPTVKRCQEGVLTMPLKGLRMATFRVKVPRCFCLAPKRQDSVDLPPCGFPYDALQSLQTPNTLTVNPKTDKNSRLLLPEKPSMMQKAQ